MLFNIFINTGTVPYYDAYLVDDKFFSVIVSNLSSLQETCSKLGGIPSFDLFYDNFFSCKVKEVVEQNKITIQNTALTETISDAVNVESKRNELQNLRSTIQEKHKTSSKTMRFFEKHTVCPTCKQEIEKSFKEKMIEENLSFISN